MLLLGAFLANHFFNKDAGETTMISDIAVIDTAAVDALIFYPKDYNFNEIQLKKEGDKWNVHYDNRKVVASSTAIQSILAQIAVLKPKRMVAKSNTSWEKYEVTDSTGIRVKVNEDGAEVADLMIGKFIYNQQTGSGTSFLRRYEDQEVYAVDGFLNMAFNREPGSFRDNQLIYKDAAAWNKITFSYPGDSSFVMMKENGYWLVNGQATDSLASAAYVSSLSRLGSTAFLDDAAINVASPQFSISIEGDGMIEPIKLNSYNLGGEMTSVVTSSLNKDGMFDGHVSDLSLRTFVGIDKFLVKN